MSKLNIAHNFFGCLQKVEKLEFKCSNLIIHHLQVIFERKSLRNEILILSLVILLLTLSSSLVHAQSWKINPNWHIGSSWTIDGNQTSYSSPVSATPTNAAPVVTSTPKDNGYPTQSTPLASPIITPDILTTPTGNADVNNNRVLLIVLILVIISIVLISLSVIIECRHIRLNIKKLSENA